MPITHLKALSGAVARRAALGFAGGRVLEPGMGTGLFFALLPAALRGAAQLTGVEYDPVTARIARLIHRKPGTAGHTRSTSPAV
jgi:tRNA A58 N-methylase Trm61